MPEVTADNEILDSWKEIAVFLRRGVRTVQRWENTEGLPVRRHGHLNRGSVYALRSDIVLWLRTREFGHTEPVNRHTNCERRELNVSIAQQRVLMNNLNVQLKLQWAKVMSSWQQLQLTVASRDGHAPPARPISTAPTSPGPKRLRLTSGAGA